MSERSQSFEEILADCGRFPEPGRSAMIAFREFHAGFPVDRQCPSTGDEVAEVFYSDATHEMKISIFQPELPLRVVEALIERAKHDLPPTHAA
jgi:hypothetical protein